MKCEFDGDAVEFMRSALETDAERRVRETKDELRRLAERRVAPEEMSAWLDEIEGVAVQARGYASRFESVLAELEKAAQGATGKGARA